MHLNILILTEISQLDKMCSSLRYLSILSIKNCNLCIDFIIKTHWRDKQKYRSHLLKSFQRCRKNRQRKCIFSNFKSIDCIIEHFNSKNLDKILNCTTISKCSLVNRSRNSTKCNELEKTSIHCNLSRIRYKRLRNLCILLMDRFISRCFLNSSNLLGKLYNCWMLLHTLRSRNRRANIYHYSR